MDLADTICHFTFTIKLFQAKIERLHTEEEEIIQKGLEKVTISPFEMISRQVEKARESVKLRETRQH